MYKRQQPFFGNLGIKRKKKTGTSCDMITITIESKSSTGKLREKMLDVPTTSLGVRRVKMH